MGGIRLKKFIKPLLALLLLLGFATTFKSQKGDCKIVCVRMNDSLN